MRREPVQAFLSVVSLPLYGEEGSEAEQGTRGSTVRWGRADDGQAHSDERLPYDGHRPNPLIRPLPTSPTLEVASYLHSQSIYGHTSRRVLAVRAIPDLLLVSRLPGQTTPQLTPLRVKLVGAGLLPFQLARNPGGELSVPPAGI